MWPPEMCPIAYTATTMTSMNGNEIIPSWAMEKGTLVPAAITPVAAAEPAPTNTRNAVPSASARSFCVVVGGAAMRFALGLGRGVSPPSARWDPARNAFDIVERCFTNVKRASRLRQEGRSDLPERNPCSPRRRAGALRSPSRGGAGSGRLYGAGAEAGYDRGGDPYGELRRAHQVRGGSAGRVLAESGKQ